MIFSTRFYSIILTLLCLAGPGAVSAQVSVSGRVTDASGPLVGVNVIVKGSKGGTSTDAQGDFSMSVSSADAVLVFSYIGYLPREIQVGAQSKLDVTLEADTKALDEVVVVGYGTKTRADLTGAVSTIKGSDLEKSPATNLTNSIAGRVPGLIANTRSGEPGNDNAEIFVRGKATLGSTGALVVIDGIPDRSGGFARLNPADIESFTVIKDATAAIYGARSANGVILITTKRGQAGKPVLSIGTNWSLTQATRVPQMLSSYQYAVATNEYDQMIGQKPTWPDASLQKFQDGSDPLGFPSTDWWEATMKKQALQQNQVISLRGGTDKVTYFLSGQYQKQNGIYKKDAAYYKQAQARANVDIAVTNDLKIGVDVLYRNELRNSAVGNYNSGAIFRELWLAYPYLVPIYPNGLVGPGIGGGPNNSMVYVTSGESGYNRVSNDFLQTKTYFKWDLSKLADGVFLDGYYAYDMTFSKTKAFTKTPPPAFRYDPATGTYVQINSSTKPSLSEVRGTLAQNLLNIRLGYANRFGDHSIEGFAAYERFQGKADEISAFRSNFLSNSLDQLSAGSLIGQQNNSTAVQTGRNNFIGRVSYGFKNKYLFDYNMRYDGSQNFPEGKRYGLFPAVSAAWRISQEDFFSAKAVTELKLRGSWGKTGNDAVSAFNYIQTYLLGTGYGYSLGPGASQVSSLVAGPTPNKDITWEVATTTDLAVDAQFLKGKLGLTIDYFRSLRSGILITRSESVPAYTGVTLPNQNLGKVLNQGIEVDAYYNGTIGNSFSYHVRGNLTFARNKVIFMDEAASVPLYQQKTNIPIDSWLVYESNGLYQNQREIDDSPHPANTAPGDIRYKDINGDGAINGLDQVRKSSVRTPQLVYGTSLGCSWRNLDFSLFVQGQAKAQSYLAPAGLNMAREFFDGRWQKEGDNQFPRSFNGPTGATRGVNTLTSDFWLRNAAFVRLKNVELGFTLPSAILKRAKMHGARIYVNGSNLFSIDQFGPSFDPEIPNSNGYYYPQQRVVNLGANISF
ncbi:SusC/RagA family TonB-linked outer membrane protein [Dyadobacter pollutisoli]|uniref:TonB-dependent receptor n=1 Tax=Dyadobacter pollutisoli TaxID=2910158 RepID=A0A9E8SQK9_9BACT|nr:TonB-dependent receptor [Dyadobacter pollutisoli]WAC13157.1 TonB-dependent receptor [Dyadobacter pollutisoli]